MPRLFCSHSRRHGDDGEGAHAGQAPGARAAQARAETGGEGPSGRRAGGDGGRPGGRGGARGGAGIGEPHPTPAREGPGAETARGRQGKRLAGLLALRSAHQVPRAADGPRRAGQDGRGAEGHAETRRGAGDGHRQARRETPVSRRGRLRDRGDACRRLRRDGNVQCRARHRRETWEPPRYRPGRVARADGTRDPLAPRAARVDVRRRHPDDQ